MGKGNLVTVNGKSFLLPFVLISLLFLLWGTAHSLLDVLNKHFQDVLGISKAKSGLVQFAMYGGYFVAALPAGYFIRKFGYRKAIVLGLLLFASGAFMFIPIAHIKEFWAVLVALFTIACGLACLETAANPYSTILGPKESAERRINLSQSLNGIGWIIGPLAGLIVFGGGGNHFDSLSIPYIILGFSVFAVALLFMFVKLPDVRHEKTSVKANSGSLLQNRLFIFAVGAQFLYVAAQTGVNSMFINYVVENAANINLTLAGVLGLSPTLAMFASPEATAAVILSFGGMGCFFIGRLSGSFIMKKVEPEKLLMLYAICSTILMAVTVVNLGFASIIALFLTYFFMSIMFPTIFSIGIRNLGDKKEKGSSIIIMSIVGGALSPILMGAIADALNMSLAFIVPLACFAGIMLFAFYAKAQNKKEKVRSEILEEELVS